ncbi:MAG: hypothetical protein U0411_14615 [Thermodesulfovibrionales bacterium]
MDFWDLLSYACWIASALLLLWMLIDFFRTGKEHAEEFLLSSREGHDEILEQERMFAEQRDKARQKLTETR